MVSTVTTYGCDCCEKEIKNRDDLVKMSIGFSDSQCRRHHGHINDSNIDYKFEICKDCLESFGLIPYKKVALSNETYGSEFLRSDKEAMDKNQSVLKNGGLLKIMKKFNIFYSGGSK